MIRRPPKHTRTDTLLPYTTRFLSETKVVVENVLNAPASETTRELLPRIEANIAAQTDEIRDTASIFRTIAHERVQFAYQLQIVFLGLYGLVALCVVMLSRKILSAVREAVSSLTSGTSEIMAGTSQQADRKSTRLNSSHYCASRMPSSA